MKLVILAVSMSALWLGGCSDDPAPTAAAPDYVVLTDDDANPDQIKGKAGLYAVTARGAVDAPLAVLDVPPYYSNFGSFALWPAKVAGGTAPFRGLQYWTVNSVYDDPCTGTPSEPGPSVEDLAVALAAQRLTQTTDPAPVSLDGHDGLYLELTVPMRVKFKDCTTGYYTFWDGEPGNAQHTADSPGLVERVWILDVDGVRAVFATMGVRAVSDAELDELATIVESVQFVDS